MIFGYILEKFMDCDKNIVNARQRGFSLLELMIAVVLGLFVMFGVLKIFSANVGTVNLQNSVARTQENGRISVELLSRDIRLADYWGCIRDPGLITSQLGLITAATDIAADPTGHQGIAGVDNSAAIIIAGETVVAGTDTLTLRGATWLSNVKVVAPFMLLPNADIAITGDVNGDASDAMVLISDCQQADLFADTDADDDVLGHAAVAAGAGTNLADALTHTYGRSAQILVPYVKRYFIGLNDDGGSSLYRSTNGAAAEELVRNVNDLQFEYGEDTTDDNSANAFLADPTAITDMDNVVSIKVALDAADSSLVRSYNVTVNIRNRTLQ